MRNLCKTRGSVTIELIVVSMLIAFLVLSVHTVTQMTTSILRDVHELHAYEDTVLEKLVALDYVPKEDIHLWDGTSEVVDGVQFSYEYSVSPYNTISLKIHSKQGSLEQVFYKDWLND